MEHKAFVVVVLLAVGTMFTSGCVLRGNSAGIAVAADATLALGGAMMVAKAKGTDCGPEPDTRIWVPGAGVARASWDACQYGKKTGSRYGTGMLVAGAVGLLVTMLINARHPVGGEAKEGTSGVDFSAYANETVGDQTARTQAASSQRAVGQTAPSQTAPSQPVSSTAESDGCGPVLAAWRAEDDDRAQLRMLANMRPVCRAKLTLLDGR